MTFLLRYATCYLDAAITVRSSGPISPRSRTTEAVRAGWRPIPMLRTVTTCHNSIGHSVSRGFLKTSTKSTRMQPRVISMLKYSTVPSFASFSLIITGTICVFMRRFAAPLGPPKCAAPFGPWGWGDQVFTSENFDEQTYLASQSRYSNRGKMRTPGIRSRLFRPPRLKENRMIRGQWIFPPAAVSEQKPGKANVSASAALDRLRRLREDRAQIAAELHLWRQELAKKGNPLSGGTPVIAFEQQPVSGPHAHLRRHFLRQVQT